MPGDTRRRTLTFGFWASRVRRLRRGMQSGGVAYVLTDLLMMPTNDRSRRTPLRSLLLGSSSRDPTRYGRRRSVRQGSSWRVHDPPRPRGSTFAVVCASRGRGVACAAAVVAQGRGPARVRAAAAQRFEPHPMELTDRRLQGRAPASVCGRIFLFCLTPPTCWQPSLDRLHFGRSLGSPTLGALQCSTPPPAPTATFPSPRRAAARTVVGNDVVLQHGAGSKRGPHALLSHFTCRR